MELPLSGVVGERLNDPDCQTIFSKVEHENAFAGSLAMLLFPLKDLLHCGMFDDGYALIILEEPLDYIRHGINVFDLESQSQTVWPFFTRQNCCRVYAFCADLGNHPPFRRSHDLSVESLR